MKYIVLNLHGIPTPFLFPEHVSHLDVGLALAKKLDASIESAGFCDVTALNVTTGGHSNSLSEHSKPGDESLIKSHLDMLSLGLAQSCLAGNGRFAEGAD